MLKILIADDHEVVQKGLRQILIDEFGETHFGEARTTSEAIDLVLRQKWDIMVLDISMPGRSGLDVLKEVKQNHPKLPVLVLSIHPEDQYALRALKAGASGYLTKDSASEELVKAVKQLREGRKYVSRTLAEKLASVIGEDEKKFGAESLSDREFQVLRLIASGKTASEIAGELSLSVKTISTYRARILEKLQLRTNAQLIHFAVQQGLVG
jgi:two-component system invasion response regulator UvrY